MTAGQYVAWRPSIVGPPPPGPAPACAPELRTEDEAVAWLGTERANLHACAGYAAAHGRLVHAVWIPAAMSGFLHTQGHWNEAVTLGQAALAAARTARDRHGQAWALNQLGMVQWLDRGLPGRHRQLDPGAGAVPRPRRPARPSLGPQRPGRGAAADRGLPGRHRQLDPGAGAVPRPGRPARPGLGPQRAWAWCSG